MLQKIIDLIKSPLKIFIFLNNKRILILSDKRYLSIRYYATFHKKLNLERPETFNEKLQWLKLYDRNPKYTKMVDKYEVRNYIKEKIGEQYLIPVLGIWNTPEEIDFENLPERYVLKCTHDTGSVIICDRKNKLNLKKIKRKLKKHLKKNFYIEAREWPYKNIKPRIIAEEYMEDKNRKELTDYKIYCFNGKCEYVMTCIDRKKGKTKFIYFDRKWNMKKEFSSDGLKYGNEIKIDCPKNLEEMFQIAEKLSEGIPFVRVDLYEVDGKVYFGEMTFFPSAGFDNTRTTECEEYLNKSLKLGEKYE